MPKIRLKQIPDGFELKNGRVTKKMKSGGAMTGDQHGYGLVTDPYNYMGDQFNNSKDNDIRFSLSSVPRDMANIEAEGGETVLTDLNNDGQFGLYNITGPRHSRGGVPMFLPEQSFVYSDTAKMKFGRRELAEFGIESRKKMTPAKVSKKFQLNEYIGALKDRDADHISLNSAELMIDKNSRSLSKLAFGQEAKKNFAEGVPLAAYPYLVERGIDPIDFKQKIENINREQAMMQSLPPEQRAQFMALKDMMAQAGQAEYGAELPKAQGGLSLFPNPPQISTPVLPDVNNFVRNAAMIRANNIANANAAAAAAAAAAPAFNPAGIPQGGQLGAGMEAYNELERLFTSGDERWEKTLDKIYEVFKDSAAKQGLTPPSKEEMIKKFLQYQKNNYMVQDLVPQGLRTSAGLDAGAKNQNTQALFNELKEQYPDLYQGYNISEDDTKLNPLFFQALSVVDRNSDEPFLSYDTVGPVQKSNWDQGTTSKADGFYGNNTLNATGQVKEPGRIGVDGKVADETDDSVAASSDVEPGDLPPPMDTPDPAFMIGDQLKLNALAMRDRDLFLPYRQSVQIPSSGYILEDPTRAIAADTEQLNIGLQAIGAFAGPQSLAARSSQAQGQAAKNIANTISRVQQRNVGTVNRGKMVDAQFRAAAEAEQRKNIADVVDATNLTLQNYMDEKNLDREQFADLMANAYANRANTYNLNTMYPYYNIAPDGTVQFAPGATPQLAFSREAVDPYDEMTRRALDLKGKLDPSTINLILKNTYGQGVDEMTGVNTEGVPVVRKGKEVKKYAVPFYTGKTGY